MRCLKRNKQTLWYALYKGQDTVYKKDENGNKIVSFTDDTTTPPTIYYEEEGITDVYEKPVKFKGNISLNKGESTFVDYGVNSSDYEAVLITNKGLLPITETSLIWANKEPKTNGQGQPESASADYRVVKVKPSLNEDRYVLSKVVK